MSEDDNEHDEDDSNVRNGDGADDIDINNSSKRSITETGMASLNEGLLSNYSNFPGLTKRQRKPKTNSSTVTEGK